MLLTHEDVLRVASFVDDKPQLQECVPDSVYFTAGRRHYNGFFSVIYGSPNFLIFSNSPKKFQRQIKILLAKTKKRKDHSHVWKKIRSITSRLICSLDETQSNGNIHTVGELTSKFPLHIDQLVHHECLTQGTARQRNQITAPLQ